MSKGGEKWHVLAYIEYFSLLEIGHDGRYMWEGKLSHEVEALKCRPK